MTVVGCQRFEAVSSTVKVFVLFQEKSISLKKLIYISNLRVPSPTKELGVLLFWQTGSLYPNSRCSVTKNGYSKSVVEHVAYVCKGWRRMVYYIFNFLF